MKPWIQYIIAFGLFVVVLWRGIIPGWNEIGTDFPNYYTSSRLLVEGRELSKLYDDDWFNDRIREYGMDEQGKFSPFPPATAFIMLPVARLDPVVAKRTWTIVNIALLVLHVVLLQEITAKGFFWAANLTMASGAAVINTIRFGQFYLALACLTMVSFLLWEKTRIAEPQRGSHTLDKIASGTLLGIGTSVKYFPSVYFLPLALQREWKIVAAGCVSLVVITGIVIVTFGSTVTLQFFANVLLPHLTGNLSGQTPFASTYQSWDSLFRKLFVFDPKENSAPFLNWPAGFAVGKAAVVIVVLGLLAFTMQRLRRYTDSRSMNLQFSAVAFAALTLLPASATYHYLLAVFPLGLFALSTEDPSVKSVRLAAIASFCAIGFLPLSVFSRFYRNGPELFLAYPRLFLVTGIFTMVIWCAHRHIKNLSRA